MPQLFPPPSVPPVHQLFIAVRLVLFQSLQAIVKMFTPPLHAPLKGLRVLLLEPCKAMATLCLVPL